MIAAKSGLHLRAEPKREARSVALIPFGVVRGVQRRGPQETIDGRTAHWLEVRYLAKSGWIFGGYTMAPSAVPSVRPEPGDLVGRWDAQWAWGPDRTHFVLNADRTFSGWLFAGAESGGGSGITIAGTWEIEKGLRLCLLPQGLNRSCYRLTPARVLVCDPDDATPLTENFESEDVSGLIRRGR